VLNSTITVEELQQFSRLIETNFGLYFSDEKQKYLVKVVEIIAQKLGYADISTLIEHLATESLTQRELDLLATSLTVGETYFFREQAALTAFEKEILPQIIKNKTNNTKNIKIWCAGCASGEEPYTLAMIIDQNQQLLKDWKIEILATDVNQDFLKKADIGLYTHWSFRDVPEHLTAKYFTKHDENSYEIDSAIKQMISFSCFNLMDGDYSLLLDNLSGMDIIFCRNVLMYFAPEIIDRTVNKFYQTLNSDGWLIVSQTELSQDYFADFTSISHADAVVYHKENNNVQPVAIPVVLAKIPIIKTQIKTAAKHQELLFVNKELFAEKPHPQKIVLKTNFEQAAIAADQGDLSGAENHCLEALKNDELNPHLLFLLATILKENGKLDEAVAVLRKVIFSDSEHILAYYNLGNIALNRGQNKEADKQFKSALTYLSYLEPGVIIADSGEMHADKLMQLIESQLEKTS